MSLTKMDESATNLPVRHIRKNDGDARSCNRSARDVRILTLCTAGLQPPKPVEIERVLAIARKLGQVFADNGGPNHAAF
jgi:hypothetical protein